MSDKKVLKESTIRKMMKLANIPALSEKFIQENYYSYNEQEEVEAEEEVAMVDMPADDMPIDDVEVGAEVEIEEPSGDLPEAEDLVQDLMGVLEKHFEDVDFNVEVEGGEEEALPEPIMDPEPPVDIDVDDEVGDVDIEIDEEEPVLESDLEEEESVGAGIADFAGITATGAEDKATRYGGLEEEDYEGDVEVDAVEVVEDDAHSKLIDAIAAKVAERLLAEAKKTNE
tara:strand:- start:5134 stop:5817 length:684 start_codon:yes stop_codon:yes gene_type:complete